MDRLQAPVTRAAALAHVRAAALDPDAIQEVPHVAFNGDLAAGGFAFAEADRRFYVVGRDGSHEVRVGGPPDLWPGWIESFWATSRHRNRRLELEELGPWQQAAVAAVSSQSTTVRDLPEEARRGLETDADLDYADYVLILINRSLVRTGKHGEASAIRLLASDDELMRPPHDSGWTRPCPICRLPSIGSHRYPRSVCDACYRKTVDSHGRLVSGHNTSFGGGFEAAYVDADGRAQDICQEVTESGRCWIGDRECTIGEARFGGVVVQAMG